MKIFIISFALMLVTLGEAYDRKLLFNRRVESKTRVTCQIEGEPSCVADEAKGECRKGTLQCINNKEVCVPGTPSRESCNGLDDDCNGRADDNVVLSSSTCTAAARGECRKGTRRCSNGREICVAGSPSREVCLSGKDEDCDGWLNDGCPTQLVDSHSMHCGWGGRGSEIFGSRCPSGHKRTSCTIRGPRNDGGLWSRVSWVTDDPYDCRCRSTCGSSFGRQGDWSYRVSSKPALIWVG